MQEFQLLHDSLYQNCGGIHQKRLASVIFACEALHYGNNLTLTALGRSAKHSKTTTKYTIKRIDRLLGNPRLHEERISIYQWHAALVCQSTPMPIILVDWVDVREGQMLVSIRASIAAKGRSVTIYEKTYPIAEHTSAASHNEFLAELKEVLPEGTKPLIVTDAGFKTPWFKAIESYGWYWVGRIRGTTRYTPTSHWNWMKVADLHTKANSKAKSIGFVRLTRGSQLWCELILYKGKSKNRKRQRSTRTNALHTSHEAYSRAAKEPWVLATNVPSDKLVPRKLVTIYSKRMQIEETFRDLKSPYNGFGLRHSRSYTACRYDVLLLIAMLVQLVYWWAGLIAYSKYWQRDFQANTTTNRAVLSIVRLGKEVLQRSNRYQYSYFELIEMASYFPIFMATHGCWGKEL